MLTKIKGTEKPEKEKPDYFILHMNGLSSALANYGTAHDRISLYRTVFHGVKAVTFQRGDTNASNAIERFQFIEMIKDCISLLTPRELMGIFPVTKTYDGNRWETKDYYSTMKALQEHGFDTVIGDKIDHLLWDYMNNTMMNFYVRLMGVVSAFVKAESGKDLLESFFEEQGVQLDTYSEFTDAKTGKRYMQNNTTSEMHRVHKPKTRHLKLVPGGVE